MSSLEYQAFLETQEFRVCVGGLREEQFPFSFQAHSIFTKCPIRVEWMDGESIRLESFQKDRRYDLVIIDCRNHHSEITSLCRIRNFNSDMAILGLVESVRVLEQGQDAISNGTFLLVEFESLPALLPWVIGQQLERKRMVLEHARIHNRLKEASYKNEMAEVASTVLHNVGNVLNSVNVAAGVVESCVNDSSIVLVNRIAGLLAEQEESLDEFLTQDPKGRRIPAAIQKLAPHLVDERQTILKEIQVLMRNIDHVKHIISSHQTMAKSQGLVEPVSLPDLLEQALELSFQPGDATWVTIYRQFTHTPQIAVDRHQVLQILVNLLRNAKQAMQAQPADDHALTLRIDEPCQEPVSVCLTIQDSGMGIAPEHLSKMFSRGFTTKKDGNGIGLHSSALTMKNMGGDMEVWSDGLGCGAVFTLRFPVDRGAKPS